MPWPMSRAPTGLKRPALGSVGDGKPDKVLTCGLPPRLQTKQPLPPDHPNLMSLLTTWPLSRTACKAVTPLGTTAQAGDRESRRQQAQDRSASQVTGRPPTTTSESKASKAAVWSSSSEEGEHSSPAELTPSEARGS